MLGKSFFRASLKLYVKKISRCQDIQGFCISAGTSWQSVECLYAMCE